jgi:hypothetical protein
MTSSVLLASSVGCLLLIVSPLGCSDDSETAGGSAGQSPVGGLGGSGGGGSGGGGSGGSGGSGSGAGGCVSEPFPCQSDAQCCPDEKCEYDEDGMEDVCVPR